MSRFDADTYIAFANRLSESVAETAGEPTGRMLGQYAEDVAKFHTKRINFLGDKDDIRRRAQRTRSCLEYVAVLGDPTTINTALTLLDRAEQVALLQKKKTRSRVGES